MVLLSTQPGWLKDVAGTDKSNPFVSMTPFCSRQWLHKHKNMTTMTELPKLQTQQKTNQHLKINFIRILYKLIKTWKTRKCTRITIEWGGKAFVLKYLKKIHLFSFLSIFSTYIGTNNFRVTLWSTNLNDSYKNAKQWLKDWSTLTIWFSKK